jgi:hypothetical protein
MVAFTRAPGLTPGVPKALSSKDGEKERTKRDAEMDVGRGFLQTPQRFEESLSRGSWGHLSPRLRRTASDRLMRLASCWLG